MLHLDERYEDGCTYRKTVLNNGIRIVTERIPHLKSVSLGIWVRIGSRFEDADLNGICHFIEHMLFKGTDRRSAYEIAREIDSVGGVLNAFTSKELTAFYCKVLDKDLDLAVDLLSDLFLNPSLPEDEIEREKQVVLQEIYQMEDTPEELVHEMLGLRMWHDDPLGRPIMGTVDSVVRLDRETLNAFKRHTYSPAETVVCAAGSVDHDSFTESIERHMGGSTVGEARIHPRPPVVQSSFEGVDRDLEQVHICLGVEGPSATSDRRYAGYILNTILGGGMSSRLFQEIREKHALAYSVYSFISSFSDTGLFGVYAGCDPDRAAELVDILGKEVRSLPSTLTEEDLVTARNHMKGNLVLAMESSEARMNRLAKGEYFFGRYLPLEEILGGLDAVTLDELRGAAEIILDRNRFNLVALGPLNGRNDLYDRLVAPA